MQALEDRRSELEAYLCFLPGQETRPPAAASVSVAAVTGAGLMRPAAAAPEALVVAPR